MLGAYPNGKPADPATYLAAVVGVLMQYPQEVVDLVTDPVKGITTECDFLPTIAELTAACELHMEHHRWAWRDQHDKRTALPPRGRVEPSEESKARVAELARGIFRDPT